MKIKSVSSQKILDSRSDWTIQTTIVLENGYQGTCAVPEGTSKGSSEAVGFNSDKSLEIIRKISPEITGKDFSGQEMFDLFLTDLDGTERKEVLGGNVLLSLSGSFAKATANSNQEPLYSYFGNLCSSGGKFSLPKMMFLMFEGGKHGAGNISIQEFMYVVDSVEEGVRYYDSIKKYLDEHNFSTLVGLEGAFSPKGLDNTKVLEILTDICQGLSIALDVAESSQNGTPVDYEFLLNNFNIVSIEDPFGEEDWENWSRFNKKYGDDILVVGDDLTTTNVKRIEKAVELDACNAVIIKPNQIGTITETLQAVSYSQKNALEVIVSHRSGETTDSFIADLAVGVGADYVKFGAPARGERVAKYNRLLEIKSELDKG